MDNGPVRGTWTLAMIDTDNTETSNLVSWRLNVVVGRPFQAK
jgi:subtilisin-like proprotein convertase family protein